jgi:hypothetical protein
MCVGGWPIGHDRNDLGSGLEKRRQGDRRIENAMLLAPNQQDRR